MKALFKTTVLLAMMVLILTPGQSFSQSGTLNVYASGATIDQIITADATNGVQKHSVYQLVSLDTTYLLDATITLQSGVSIVGVPDPTTGKLPCIEADILSDGSIPGIFFTLTGARTSVALKNLYILGIAPNKANNTGSGQGVQVSADSISLTIDNCVFDEISQFEIGYSSNADKFFITNTKFRNGIDVASAYYVPELLRSENYAGAWSTDTISIKYNTLLGIAMGPVITTGVTKYFEFSHNDVLLTSKGPFWSEQVVNAKLDNNIFYNVYAVGETHAEYAGGWDEIAPPRIPSIFYFAPLSAFQDSVLLGHAKAGSADSLAAEALRKVEVKNNAYFWSSGLTSFWTSWNDTATTAFDSLYTPVFMNSQTAAMFGNSVWPGFVQSGNQNVDPGFGPTIDKALSPGTDTTYGVGLLAWVAAVRSGTGTTQSYSYQKTQVGSAANWTPTWPLPESADLKYSSSSVKSASTDGLPLGDPYWFTGKVTGVKTVSNVPHTYSLSQNYPNPFNPSTVINYSLEKPSNVSLAIYNVLGQKVSTLVNQFMQAGSYSYSFDASRLASGVYFYRIEAGTFVSVKKMLLMK
jgi:hypothetical protein